MCDNCGKDDCPDGFGLMHCKCHTDHPGIPRVKVKCSVSTIDIVCAQQMTAPTEIKFENVVMCEKCNGCGDHIDIAGIHDCSKCKGRGYHEEEQSIQRADEAEEGAEEKAQRKEV